MEGIIFAVVIALIAIVLIVLVFDFAMKQREKELIQKETILNKEH
jgi:cell division protein FtsX